MSSARALTSVATVVASPLVSPSLARHTRTSVTAPSGKVSSRGRETGASENIVHVLVESNTMFTSADATSAEKSLPHILNPGSRRTLHSLQPADEVTAHRRVIMAEVVVVEETDTSYIFSSGVAVGETEGDVKGFTIDDGVTVEAIGRRRVSEALPRRAPLVGVREEDMVSRWEGRQCREVTVSTPPDPIAALRVGAPFP